MISLHATTLDYSVSFLLIHLCLLFCLSFQLSQCYPMHLYFLNYRRTIFDCFLQLWKLFIFISPVHAVTDTSPGCSGYLQLSTKQNHIFAARKFFLICSLNMIHCHTIIQIQQNISIPLSDIKVK